MNDTELKDYFVDVGLNILKGSAVAAGFSALFVAFIMSIFFFFEGPPGSEFYEQQRWCDKHHPTLSYSACSIEAGW